MGTKVLSVLAQYPSIARGGVETSHLRRPLLSHAYAPAPFFSEAHSCGTWGVRVSHGLRHCICKSSRTDFGTSNRKRIVMVSLHSHMGRTGRGTRSPLGLHALQPRLNTTPLLLAASTTRLRLSLPPLPTSIIRLSSPLMRVHLRVLLLRVGQLLLALLLGREGRRLGGLGRRACRDELSFRIPLPRRARFDIGGRHFVVPLNSGGSRLAILVLACTVRRCRARNRLDLEYCALRRGATDAGDGKRENLWVIQKISQNPQRFKVGFGTIGAYGVRARRRALLAPSFQDAGVWILENFFEIV